MYDKLNWQPANDVVFGLDRIAYDDALCRAQDMNKLFKTDKPILAPTLISSSKIAVLTRFGGRRWKDLGKFAQPRSA